MIPLLATLARAADTAAGASADTASAPPAASGWVAGDDIPGWDDADCSESVPGATSIIRMPDLYGFEMEFPADAGWAGPGLAEVLLRDCAFSDCLSSTDLNRAEPYLEVWLDGTWGDAGEVRGQGWWGPDDTDPRHVAGAGNSVLTGWSTDAAVLPAGGLWMQPATAEVCLERVRPDEVRGRVRVVIVPEGWSIYAGYYGYLVLSFPFDVLLPEHGGFDTSAADNGAAPDGYDQAHFLYGASYDDAWPWDDITDATIRETVYERYLPFNTE